MSEDKVKKIIDQYLEFECPGEDGKMEKPFLIVAPDRSYKNHLRIYVHGGLAGRLGVYPQSKNEPMSEKYLKYSPTMPETTPEKIESPEYLKYAEEVCRNKWLKKTKSGKNGDRERAVQDKLTKQFMYRCSHEPDALLVTDLEYKIPRTLFGKSPEVDFILFDGQSFGFVEFKADGKSMQQDAKNSLEHHMETFDKLLSLPDDQMKKEYLECCRRLKILFKVGLVDESWKDAINALPEKEESIGFPEKLFWCGFLFVGGDEGKIEAAVKDQLKAYKDSNLDIRYQFSEEFPDKLTMDESVRNILTSNAE